MSSVKHAVIAAAGMGSRLGRKMTKCMVEVNGKTLLEYQLDVLNNIDDIRIVVGYKKEVVINMLETLGRKVTIIHNDDYLYNTTADSYDMGAEGIDEYTLFMDADIIFMPDSFKSFTKNCQVGKPLIAVTKPNTEDAVFVEIDQEQCIRGFSRTQRTDYEWANLAWLPSNYFNSHKQTVFETLAGHPQPLKTHMIESYEVDTEVDFARAASQTDRFEKIIEVMKDEY